ncbi:MAG: helix-turn-helix transcriptional regulator [Bacteroidales bacterium]|nr:helix-turn-helix transcriptional regulator [Bacteroidales bacterium]
MNTLFIVTGISVIMALGVIGLLVEGHNCPVKVEEKEQSSEKKADPKPYTPSQMVQSIRIQLKEELGGGETDLIAQKLMDYFEREKPYLNPDIKILDMADVLCTNKTYLSKAVNGSLGKNFSQIVNWYRVRDAVNLYASNPDLTIDELRIKSGFRSVSTFNTAFSKYTGKTPADWCKSYKRHVEDVTKSDM